VPPQAAVGVRTTCRAPRIRTPTGSLALATSPFQGEDEQQHSRGAFFVCARVLPAPSKQTRARSSSDNAGGGTGRRQDKARIRKLSVSRTRCAAQAVHRRSGTFANSEFPKVPVLQRTTSCCAAPGKHRKKQEAERRQTLCNNLRALRRGTAPTLTLPRARGRAWEGAARLSAFHHGTCGSDRTPPLSFSHATSGDLVGARIPMVRKTRTSQRLTRIRPANASPRVLPAPSCPSPARLHPRSGHDAGRACPAEAAQEHR
jgi:hypothetical protein